ncbi:hypothetical protein RMATCC62417_06441 [Rhizopus microsporus]|nr:hypothetical protein RMATCC62417_06441 [Rhizopus microsporus]
MSVPEGCPMHQEQKKPESGCPVNHQKEKPQKPMPQPSQIPPGCPMHNSAQVNQDNMMPQLTQTKQPDQTIDLPTERVISSIPKSKDSEAKWEYPSPQQFYNALRRKGWETPEDEIETMVDIHNFLNEEAWQEVLKWEKKYKCDCAEDPYLSKFQGRPKELTPKARWHSLLGFVYIRNTNM